MASDKELYHLYTFDRMSYRQIADYYGFTEDGVRGMVGRYRREVMGLSNRIIQLDTPTVSQEPPPPSLASMNDRGYWRVQVDDLLHSQDTVTVMHGCDRHEPFKDEIADEGFYSLAALVKPDIVVRGSDEEDNPTISYFIEQGAEEPQIGDFLDSQYVTRRYHTNRTRLIVPSALQVSIEANHGYSRLIKWINKYASASKDTLLRRYVENIRCDGAVSWIGWKESVRIGNALVVMHGKKYGVNSAKQTLEMRSNSISITAGHAHRPNWYSTVAINPTTGKTYPVTCTISGCLSIIPAHYADDEDDSFSTWQHSTVVSTIDVKSGQVEMENVRFYRDGNRAWFVFGGKVYEYGIQAILGKKVA